METIPALLESRLTVALARIVAEASSLSSTPASPLVSQPAELSGYRPQVTVATDARFGDYQTNVAMILAKQQRTNPRQLAQQIIPKLEVAEICDPPEIAGAGFINFRLKAAWLAERFRQVFVVEDARQRLAGELPRLGVPPPARPQKIVIDFSSPNVAKPMHVGHIRSTILGDALARIAGFVGHKVIRDNHIGDWGTQFGMLLLGWKTALDRAALEADPLGEMERIYKLISANCRAEPVALENAKRELVKLQDGDAENLRIWHEMIRLSQAQFDAIYGRLGVKFDVALGESFYNSELKGVAESLRQQGIATESEGAWCVFSDGTMAPESDPFLIKDKDGWRANPALVQKSDGAANYTTTDLATLDYRLKTWAPDAIIYVTDGRQQLHFRQLFAIFGRWQPEAAARVRLEHVWFGTILGEDGKPFKTRSGETIKLADLLDEAEERALKIVTEKNPALQEDERRVIARVIGLGAIKYADLLPNRQSDYVFSWDRMLSFQGNTSPYLQYSYVRILSIFRKAEAGTRGENPMATAETSTTASFPEIALVEPAELALAKKLFQFGEVLPQVLEDHRPNLLANYLYDLASIFHGFFETCPVLKSEGVTRSSRFALCRATANVLRQGLDLLGIEAPERM